MAEHKAKKKGFLFHLYHYRYLLVMILPVLIHFILFSYIPMGGIVIAFKKYNFKDGIWGSPWNGLKNFKFFFSSGEAWRVTRNTFLYNIAFMVCSTFVNVVVAIALSEIKNKYFKKISQSVMLLPHFISWVVVSAITYALIGMQTGVINNIIANLGYSRINFYAMPKAWKWILVIAYIWKGTGYGSIVYLATITGIDTSYYEAAEVDGATAFQKVYYITLPFLRPTIVTMILLTLGNSFRGNFGMFFPMVGTNGLLYQSTDVIDTFVYRLLMNNNNYSQSTAIGLYQSVLCFVFIIFVNWITKKIDSDSALF